MLDLDLRKMKHVFKDLIAKCINTDHDKTFNAQKLKEKAELKLTSESVRQIFLNENVNQKLILSRDF